MLLQTILFFKTIFLRQGKHEAAHPLQVSRQQSEKKKKKKEPLPSLPLPLGILPIQQEGRRRSHGTFSVHEYDVSTTLMTRVLYSSFTISLHRPTLCAELY